MKYNQCMKEKLSLAKWNDLTLPDKLQSWVKNGFVEKDGCFFMADLYANYPGLQRFPDRTGAECFVNSFHIDDYVSERYLDYSCLFCNEMLKNWDGVFQSVKINAIISVDDLSSNIKIHVKRNDEYWLTSDFDEYHEAVLEIDSPFSG